MQIKGWHYTLNTIGHLVRKRTSQQQQQLTRMRPQLSNFFLTPPSTGRSIKRRVDQRQQFLFFLSDEVIIRKHLIFVVCVAPLIDCGIQNCGDDLLFIYSITVIRAGCHANDCLLFSLHQRAAWMLCN